MNLVPAIVVSVILSSVAIATVEAVRLQLSQPEEWVAVIELYTLEDVLFDPAQLAGEGQGWTEAKCLSTIKSFLAYKFGEYELTLLYPKYGCFKLAKAREFIKEN